MNPSFLYSGPNFLHHTTCFGAGRTVSAGARQPVVDAPCPGLCGPPERSTAGIRSSCCCGVGLDSLSDDRSLPPTPFVTKERDVWLSIRAEYRGETRETETSALTPNTAALCGSSWRRGRHTQTSLEGGSCGDPGHSEDMVRHDKHDCTSLHKI